MSESPPSVPLPEDGLPLLVTAANIREEKNHLRAAAAMRRLFSEGLRFHWINIGSTANAPLTAKLRQAVRSAGLEKFYHLTGALDNPYSVMRRADAVCVLSDHESWSMVITEAKTLGVPVIATRTSGALEQIEDGETGLLCGFSVSEIAAAIRNLLTGRVSGAHIRKNLARGTAYTGPETLEALLQNRQKKVLYVFDDINYESGARAAALVQARAVSGVAEVRLYSAEPCRDTALRRVFRFLDPPGGETLRLLAVPTRQVLRDRAVPRRGKMLRIAYAVLARLGREAALPNALLRRDLAAAFEGFDTIFVVSEASRLRDLVSRRRHPVKVQWIHTDYAAWHGRSEWSRAVTKNDAALYRRFDAVVCLDRTLRDRFLAVHPHLAEKTLAVPNPVSRAEIRARAAEPLTVPVDEAKFNLISVGRLEEEKRYDRLLGVASVLRDRGLSFHWYFVGGGSLYAPLRRLCEALGLGGYVTLTGRLENPCPLLARCDALIVFSEYEGTPVTVDEAKALGVPVIANDVGGIREQMENGKYGEIVPDRADDMARAILRAAEKEI